jgi:hypothetical protein
MCSIPECLPDQVGYRLDKVPDNPEDQDDLPGWKKKYFEPELMVSRCDIGNTGDSEHFITFSPYVCVE